MPAKKPRIVVMKEGVDVNEVVDEAVIKNVKGLSAASDAVEVMAEAEVPDEDVAMCNQEFNLVEAEMTDAEAKKVENDPAVEAVEEDVWDSALQTDDFDNDFPMEMTSELDLDGDATAEIDEMFQHIVNSYTDDDDVASAEAAAETSQTEVSFDDIDFDESGQVISLNEEAAAGPEAAGIPRDKLIALVKCIIKCAIENFGGNVKDVSDEAISKLLHDADLPYSLEAAQAIRDYITCGLRIIYAPIAWRASTGAGARVAVVDTGIAPRHPDLRVYGGVSYVPGRRSWADDNRHGTHVAGTIGAVANNRGVIGVAPRCRLYAVKVLNGAGSGRRSWILNGLAWCYRYRMHIVNLSLGAGATTHNPRVYSAAYEAAGRALRRRRILAVAAAGNSGRTSRPFVGNPARCPSFMAVSAVDCRRRRASFSSYGPQVEICGPGVGVWSTVPPNRYAQLSGTSMATPHVAGVAALVKARYPSASGDAIRRHLRRMATDLGPTGPDPFFGSGLVNARRSLFV